MQASLELTLNKSKVSLIKESFLAAQIRLCNDLFTGRVDFIIVVDFLLKPGKCNPRSWQKKNAEIFSYVSCRKIKATKNLYSLSYSPISHLRHSHPLVLFQFQKIFCYFPFLTLFLPRPRKPNNLPYVIAN